MIKPAIVIVEAFPEVRHKLKTDLEQKYSDHFRIIETASGEQALNQLKQMSLHNEPVALLLADEQMSEMNGSEILKEVRDLYPKAKRILLTTYTDTHAAIQAINTALIDYYLMKPWDPPEERLYPVLDDLLAEWLVSYPPHFAELRVIGHRWSPRLHEIVDFLTRNQVPYRSEERRVGKECRSRWSPYHSKKKIQGVQAQDDDAIVVDNFTKSYGSNRFVDHLTFTVHQRDGFALLGPNGSVTTTTIETLAGDMT